MLDVVIPLAVRVTSSLKLTAPVKVWVPPVVILASSRMFEAIRVREPEPLEEILLSMVMESEPERESSVLSILLLPDSAERSLVLIITF